jgi:hypothetical protein
MGEKSIKGGNIMKKYFILSLDTNEDMLITIQHSDPKTINDLVNELIEPSLPNNCSISNIYSEWRAIQRILGKKAVNTAIEEGATTECIEQLERAYEL